jgi:hypothetical protein
MFWPPNAGTPRAFSAAGLSVLLTGVVLFALLGPLAAGTGDKKGWSVLTDPRKRAFLIWVPLADGPRVVTFGCLRDVDTFTVLSEDVADDQRPGPATLTVSNGKARYDVAGNIAPDPVVNQPIFSSDLPGDKKARSDIAAKLLPVLEGRGPILYEIGLGAARNDMSKSLNSIPISGLAQPLTRFKSICFGS